VIATGARPVAPRIPGLAESGALDHAGIWGLAEQPASLAILGAGPDAVEWAQAFARLGSQVTILTDAERILPEDDRDVSEQIRDVLAADGVTIRTGAKIAGVGLREGRRVVTYRVATEVDPSEAVADRVLVAESRLANVEELNLESVGIFADPFDGIPVDDYLQTRAPTISALGDVLGHHRWAHAAEREAEVVFRNAILRLPLKMDYRAVPRVIYTDPEVASVGQTAAATDNEPPAHCVKVDLSELARAHIDGAERGFAKVLADGAGRVLGATVVAPQASAIIMEFILAMDRGLSLPQLADSIHPDPSYAGLAGLVASRFRAERQRTRIAGSVLRWFYGYETGKSSGGP
jgi:pyruvate/2-oxoglutarate dehydrogenase complex dihydrolipoamide dehydrogenase (E3) component